MKFALKDFPVSFYDLSPFLTFVVSAIGTSWLNADEESCLDEGKCQCSNSQRKQEDCHLNCVSKIIISIFEISWNSSVKKASLPFDLKSSPQLPHCFWK